MGGRPLERVTPRCSNKGWEACSCGSGGCMTDRVSLLSCKLQGENMYSMRCNGCRPGTCPGGRDNFGYCLTTTGTTDPNTPTCAANEMHFRNQFSGDLAREGCRPKTCPTPNGRNMFTGNCRACPDPLNYHNGTTCVPALGGDTISNRLCGPSGILHMGTGFMYNGYNNCIEINCPNGCNPNPILLCRTTTVQLIDRYAMG